MVGLWNNINKTVGVVYKTCLMTGVQLNVDCVRSMTGVGASFQDIQR